MEKIYMEESKKQKKSVMNFSVVLSFVVAIFAVFSLAMFGIVSNQGTGVSYAATLGDSFTLTKGPDITVYSGDPDADGTKFLAANNYYSSSDMSLKSQVFCVERPNITVGTTYTKTSAARSGVTNIIEQESVKPGLMFLLGLPTSGRDISEITGYPDANVNAWVIQSAVWLYLSEKTSDDVYKLFKDDTNDADDKVVLDSDVVFIEIGDGALKRYTGLTGRNGAIRKLVNEANETSSVAAKVNVEKADGEFAKTDDGQYYQSPAITVTGEPSSTLEGYTVSVSGIDNVLVVDENGNEVPNNKLAAGNKFYIRVPADKVTKQEQTLKINVKGHFTAAEAYYYVSDSTDHQRMANVEPGDRDGALELVISDDTGMNVTQTIYFIGLIVLLCGVGIVYANAKPVEAKQ